MSQTWKQTARRDLMELRGRSSAWSYRRQGSPSVEPTALACLGLLASGDERTFAGDLAACCAGADWMAAIQRSEGALPVSQSLATPGWATPYAILLWSGVPGHEAARRRARTWLLGLNGRTIPHTKGVDLLIGHDSTAVGWPWVDGTHSWLEPTALAVLALCREGLAGHPRVGAGIALILNRSLEKGGWNYGNKTVFGRDLRPQPGPTGVALLALAACGDRSPAVARALEYLRLTLPSLGSAVSLGWGVLALRAHGACPLEADAWLAACYQRCAGRADATMGVALLLLAASDKAIRLIVRPGTNEATTRKPSNPADPLISRNTS
ncbi:MAG: hypothetical protein ACHRXM_38340 [Isosphaerales bacterium]